ncbi:MAG TPA: DinB family protein [Dehalococcoidia bacterium]|jgi:hypothetical protein|nr:DinB family protein [Dehalococcoidia bacterium]
MSRAAVEQLLYLISQAFEEDGEHSLLRNLGSVSPDTWLWVPPGGALSVRQIVGHVGACKYMYDNFAFGDARMTWGDPAGATGLSMEDLQSSANLRTEPSSEALVEWLREGQRGLVQNVSALDDDRLRAQRQRPEGGMKETRWIIGVMIEHDLYHAGEINHLRALHEGNDRWAWADA